MDIIKSSGRQNMRIEADKEYGTVDNYQDFREQMLINNHIEGLLEFETIYENNRKIYEYKVESLKSLEMICGEEKLKGEMIGLLLTGILETLKKSSDYMLQTEDFCLEKDAIYIDKNHKVKLAYFPGYGESIISQLNRLSDFMMNMVDYKDDMAVLLTYALYMKTKESDCSLSDLEDLIYEKMQEKNEVLHERNEVLYEKNEILGTEKKNEELIELSEHDYYKKDRTEGIDVKTTNRKPEKYLKGIWEFANGTQKVKMIMASLIPFLVFGIALAIGLFKQRDGEIDYGIMGATLVVAICASVYVFRLVTSPIMRKKSLIETRRAAEGIDDETVMLSIVNTGEPLRNTILCSLVSDTDPTINIDKVPFCIGTDEKSMDFALKKIGVSRKHVRITKENDAVMICDLNSTNGVYVNGLRLTPQKEMRINRGDKINIGTCCYFLN